MRAFRLIDGLAFLPVEPASRPSKRASDLYKSQTRLAGNLTIELQLCDLTDLPEPVTSRRIRLLLAASLSCGTPALR